jgi:hypothetical protein
MLTSDTHGLELRAPQQIYFFTPQHPIYKSYRSAMDPDWVPQTGKLNNLILTISLPDTQEIQVLSGSIFSSSRF